MRFRPIRGHELHGTHATSGRPCGGRLLLVASALLLASACHTPLESGIEALAEGNYQKAEKQARTGLSRDRSDPEYNLLMADILVAKEDYAEAERYAKRAFDANTIPARAGRTYGKVLWELDRPVEGVQAWRAARAADPASVPDEDFVRALDMAISVGEQDHEYEAVLSLRMELAELRPDHPQATTEALRATREALAADLVREGSYERAVEVYESLSTDYPERADYALNRGHLLATLGEDKRAIAAFDAYAAIGPAEGLPKRLADAAEQAEKLGSFVVAVHFYDRAITALPDKATRGRARMHRKLAGLLLSAGASDQGSVHLRAFVADRAAIGSQPVSAEIYLTAAGVATQNRHPELALELLEEATTAAGPSWRVSRELAELYARRGRNADVERVLRQYVERASDAVSARIVVGRWAASRQNFELARFFLEAAVQDPAVPATVWLEIARVYSALGFVDEVRLSLLTYTKRAPDKRRAQLDVASIYMGQRLYEEAEKALLAALKLEPKDLIVVKLLEDLYREWGRPKKVHEAYERWVKARGNKPGDLQLVGERFYRQQDYDDALPYLIKAAKGGENDAWLQVADCYQRQRKERDMKDALEKYLAGSEERARGLAAVLQRYRATSWDRETIAILEELVALEPRNIRYHQELSQLYFDQGRDVEAFELWKGYISRAPNPVTALEQMARRFSNRSGWMLQFLEQVLEKETNPDPRIYKLLGDAHKETGDRNRLGATSQSAIFTAQNKAQEYYSRYLEEGRLDKIELSQFANEMQRAKYSRLASRAFERLEEEGPLQANQMLDYGKVLLSLGRATEAEKLFTGYFDKRKGSVDAANMVATALMDARRFEAAIPYLEVMMQDGDENILGEGFLRLANVLTRTNKADQIPALVATYLDRSQNPTNARTLIQRSLEEAGLWEAQTEQLQRLVEVHGPEEGFELGVALFRAGKPDHADDAFRNYASASANPAEAWKRIAQFYGQRLQPERAREALQNAVNASPDDEALLAEFGTYLILSGRVNVGRDMFEKARTASRRSNPDALYKAEIDALRTSGHFAEARELARQAANTAMLDKDYFAAVAVHQDLISQDKITRQRALDYLRRLNLPLFRVVALLVSSGHLEEAAEVIDKEIADGDYIAAGNILTEHADVFLQLGGVERLMRSARPLLEKGNQDVAAGLGFKLVERGDLDRGARLLRQSVELGSRSSLYPLAKVYARLGHHTEAFQAMQQSLATAANQRGLLEEFARLYELLGESAKFMAVLDELSKDPRYAAAAIPVATRHLVQSGQIAEVVSVVSNVELVAGLDDGANVGVNALVAAVEELAIAGYVREAVDLLRSAPQSLREREQCRDLRLRLAAFTDGLDTDAEFRTALGVLADSSDENRQKLKIATLASIAGRSELAREIAEPLLKSSDATIAAAAAEVLLRDAVANDELDRAQHVAAAFVAVSEDKLGAHRDTAQLMRAVGRDTLAHQASQRLMEAAPNSSNVAWMFEQASLGGSLEQSEKALADLKTIGAAPSESVDIATRYAGQTHERALGDTLIATLENGGYQTSFVRARRVSFEYRTGEPYIARDLLEEYLTRVDYDPEAVQWALRLQAGMTLWGDMARWLAPRVDETKLSIESLRLLGLANLKLGFNPEALRLLDKTVDMSADPAHEATLLAAWLAGQRLWDASERYARMGIEARPGRTTAYYYRGLARLARGDVANARDDIERGAGTTLGRGIDEDWLQAAEIAIEAGQNAYATELFEKVLRGPVAWPSSGLQQFASRLAEQPASAKVGVELFEKARPTLAAGYGFEVGVPDTVSALASLYEAAGNSERSFSLYRGAMKRAELTDPLGNLLLTWRNNLSYAYSTVGVHLDEGEALVQGALAFEDRRRGNVLDTLGWIYYRQGRLEEAEREIRKALRSADTGDHPELFRHLAAIRAARGYHGEANWLNFYADALDPRQGAPTLP